MRYTRGLRLRFLFSIPDERRYCQKWVTVLLVGEKKMCIVTLGENKCIRPEQVAALCPLLPPVLNSHAGFVLADDHGLY